MPKFEFEVNFSTQSTASLTGEDLTYLRIAYHHVYYLKYAELKRFFGCGVWATETSIPASKSIGIHLCPIVTQTGNI